MICRKRFFLLEEQLIAPFFNEMPLLPSLIPRACKQGIKSKAGAMKWIKEKK